MKAPQIVPFGHSFQIGYRNLSILPSFQSGELKTISEKFLTKLLFDHVLRTLTTLGRYNTDLEGNSSRISPKFSSASLQKTSLNLNVMSNSLRRLTYRYFNKCLFKSL